jgi:RNA polymerase sigma factor (sigma-70 family)
MAREMSDSSSAARDPFGTTHWSVVLAAGRDDTRGHEALDKLCRTYWRPLYFFVRRHGHSPADAEDLTQEFFARLLEKNAVGLADPARGKFRAFLLTSLRHFLTNEWERGKAQKRGGGARLISLDTGSAETRYGLQPVDQTTPENLFEREWFLTLLEQALSRLRAEHETAGKADQFVTLQGCLMGEPRRPYSELAVQLHMSEDAVKMAVHRLKKRCGELLQDEIAQTVSDRREIDEEMKRLLVVLGSC